MFGHMLRVPLDVVALIGLFWQVGAADGCEGDACQFDELSLLAVRQKVTRGSELRGKANLTLTRHFPPECIATVTESQWFGTAPWCGAHEGDCQNYGGRLVQECSDCDGSSCWVGTKVRCEREITRGIKDECNPLCSPFFTQTWVGTAPWCGGTECDCIATRSVPMQLASDGSSCECDQRGNCGRFGATCWTGQKILCVQPKSLTAAYEDGLSEMQQECTDRMQIREETRRAMISTLGDIAKAGIEAAAAGGAAAGR